VKDDEGCAAMNASIYLVGTGYRVHANWIRVIDRVVCTREWIVYDAREIVER